MPLDVLPDEVIVKPRDEWLALYLRSHQLRAPEASVAEGSEPYITGSALADQLNLLSENARQIARSIPLASVKGKKLDALLKALGLPPRFPETGSQGAVIPITSIGGADVQFGAEVTDQNGQIFYCTATGHYTNPNGLAGVSNVPIAAKSTGPSTNLAPGTKLTWSATPGGLVSVSIVATQTDGSGLSGGRLTETDEEIRNRISDAYANPAAAGNDAAYRAAIEYSQGHGVAVQRAFTIPCALGPGTTAFTFTMNPATPGGSRRPNATQIQQVRDYLIGQFPADDGIFDCVLLPQYADFVIRLNWADGAEGWTDAVPWPPYYSNESIPSAIIVTSATSPTVFSVGCVGSVDSSVIAPQVGNNIAFFDFTQGRFQQKRILTVSGGSTGPWALTVDTTNAVSDTTYTPSIGQRVCPWSESINRLVPPVLKYLGQMGPGEQFASFFDPGARQRRSPASPRFWPSVVSNRLAADILDVDAVGDATLVEGLGLTTIIGVPGATAYLIELNFLSAFPL